MAFKIFYSWQSKTANKYNWFFIDDCLKDVAKLLHDTYGEEAEFFNDKDTKGVPGYPDIPQTLLGKIEDCDVFLADLTVIGRMNDNQGVINQNVMTELGYALAKLGEERIVLVMNTFYGDPKNENLIPFDLDHRRFPFPYNLSEGNWGDRKQVKNQLVKNIFGAIRSIYETHHERLKKDFLPFETWRTWDASTPKKFDYELNDDIRSLFKSIRENSLIRGSVTRVLGLSGLGKTKLVLECFRPDEEGMTTEVCNTILYANLNECNPAEVTATIRKLYRDKVRKVIVLDNCSLSQHEIFKQTFANEGCTLSLITISPEPNENHREIDPDGRALILKLDARKFKPIVKLLLEKNFPELTPEDVDLFVDYSNGLPFFAVLLGNNREIAKVRPGTLAQNNILDKLLGSLYSDPENRKIILACTVFSRFGFFEELQGQSTAIAESLDLCMTQEQNAERRLRRFNEVCSIMQERNLLERIGFSLSFRPTPLALKLAEEWWADCTTDQFLRIVPILAKHHLTERFCEQFRLLTHIEHAKEIVGNLCEGVFSTAEVLNTEVGSRLFRSFVNVNPQACAAAIKKAFGNLSKEALYGVGPGRRNLIWALEQLCFRSETFNDSVKILASFADAENEEITNNATGQFLHLFHVHLPGTEVDLPTRWSVIEYYFAKDGSLKSLGFNAALRALKADTFSRMINSDEQFSGKKLNDYNPTYDELGVYWRNAIGLLKKVALSNNEFSERATEALLQQTFGIAEHGHGQLIMPVLIELLEAGAIRWAALRSTLQFMMGHNAIRDSRLLKNIEEILVGIVPDTFTARFEIYVKQPTSNDYYTRDQGRLKKEDFIPRMIEKTAEEFAANPDMWHSVMQILATGHIAEGHAFGQQLGKRIVEIELNRRFIALFLEQIVILNKEDRNLSILTAFLSATGDKKLITDFLDFLYAEPKLSYLAFNVAKQFELPFSYLMKLFELVSNNAADVGEFSNFYYGWGIKHLTDGELTAFLDQIALLGDKGHLVVFGIINTWSYDDEELWNKLLPLAKKLLMDNGGNILEMLERSSDYYLWGEAVTKILKADNDEKFASIVIDNIISNCNKSDGLYSTRDTFHNIFDILADRYPELLWDKLGQVYLNIEKFGIAAFHFRDLLGSRNDYRIQTSGLLARNVEIFNHFMRWCKQHKDLKLFWPAGIIPIYDPAAEQQPAWHPYALEFLKEFGHDQTVLNEISAKMGSYSWMGSLVPKLQEEIILFTRLKNFPVKEVREWAIGSIENLEKRITFERNRDEEFS